MKPPKTFDRPIAWVCRTVEESGKTEVIVDREGMTREEMKAHFPPVTNNNGNIDFDRKGLIKSIIYEAYREAVDLGKSRPRQNIRGFWYERIMYTLINVMGEVGDSENISSIETSINAAWKDLVEAGYVTYTELNLYSEKESNYKIAVKEDSPYPTAVVIVEKAALFDALHDLADIYEISFCSLGGQSSRAAAMAYATKLENIGIDLDQDFTVYSFCDFDPEGWIMPEKFCDHLRLKITGNIDLIRLGVLPDQLGQSVIDQQAIPYPLEAKRESARKAKQTKYDNFAAATGGLYIPNHRGEQVPARVELNIYDDDQIRDKIVAGLVEHLDGFEFQIRTFKKAIESQYDDAWRNLVKESRESVNEEYEPFFDEIEGVRTRLEVEESGRATEERQQIRNYQRQIHELFSIIDEKTADIQKKRHTLERLEVRLDNAKYHHYENAVLGLQESDIPGPDDLIEKIESNGGWQEWAEDRSLTAIDSDDLTAAAKKKPWGTQGLNLRLEQNERESILEWIEEEIEDAPTVYTIYFDESPEEMIARAIEEAFLD